MSDAAPRGHEAGGEGPGPGRRVAMRARELALRGAAGLDVLPTVDQFEGFQPGERRNVLRRLRVELYAVACILADGTVARALRERLAYPPYGLVRSMYSQLRMVLAAPGPFPEGSVDSFEALGRAYVDTMVFHLDQLLKQQRASEGAWLVDRLERALALFRVDADASGRARMRDAVSFLYGGLHFGTSVSVQLAEAMTRRLAAYPDLTAAEKAEILARSSRPAFQLSALNVAHVVPAHQQLMAPMSGGPGESGPPAGPARMDPACFSVQEVDGRPWRIGLRDESGLRAGAGIPTTYATHGCPARVSPNAGTPAIGTLWAWCAGLARDVGLLEEPGAGRGRGTDG